jgi:hypothetical protein
LCPCFRGLDFADKSLSLVADQRQSDPAGEAGAEDQDDQEVGRHLFEYRTAGRGG